ncbi:hypothetical protein RHSIM_Rhsim08G0231300 [Rhododendron simsii]|uniref:DUF4283 domain-containing protein n=1 Tax=Rhododendron simsii TaxID=118357 RepID=A0A834LHG0_RHOSS|nr:hypothetical protein RHSIM_Rhsim08G0231300 [Rhododendron simsii]
MSENGLDWKAIRRRWVPRSRTKGTYAWNQLATKDEVNEMRIPIQGWNTETMSKIGKLWGEVITKDEETMKGLSFIAGKVQICTEQMDVINQTIFHGVGSWVPVEWRFGHIVHHVASSNWPQQSQ